MTTDLSNRCLLAASRRRQACLNLRPSAMKPWFPGGSRNPASALVKQAKYNTSTTQCGQERLIL
ncbi:hypothetical protein PR202_gb27580 [Eleusine coracana subsp. coracana]|uniref:Uncharacterized protein n=1 Tax=Eleusine coracana subsp. coracana TaxID=191504 RepID=A0AAV5FUU0_ELECO|nr:hypothetical protein PR202_gb27580 [Eleusine coracana subsp. coracana]